MTESTRIMAAAVGLTVWAATALSAQTGVETGYGRRTGSGYGGSLNGTSTFAQLFENRGRNVVSLRRITPRIDDFQTIVWFPNRLEPPRREVVDHLNEWCQAVSGRKLIYVGGDYDAAIHYWGTFAEKTTGASSEQARRLRSEAMSKHRSRVDHVSSDLSCDWFNIEIGHDQRATGLTGPWCTHLRSRSADIRSGSIRLVPPQGNSSRTPEVFLDSDAGPLVYQVVPSNAYESHVMVIRNGSMLLNYGLVNPENRVVAEWIVREANPYGPVLFLETGPEDAEISNTNSEMNSQWAWIGQPPLRFVVPQFLILGIVYCFVWFPIFGRCRRTLRRNNTDFGSHIEALARSISTDADDSRSAQVLRRYRDQVRKESAIR